MILLTPYKRYYEQVDGQTTDITKEIPFDLPEGWTWARIRSILLQTGSKIPSGVYFDYIDIDAIDNSTNKITEPKHILVKDAPSRASREILPGDTLFSLVRPYLKNIALVEEAHRDYIASTGFYVCRPSCGANYRYLFYTMISDFTVNGINSFIKGDNSPSVRREDIEKFLFPLPPLTEQQRIVAQIESLLKCVDEIDRESETLEKSLTLAKQKILDLAIRGKLVQQDPTDEPASELLKKIKAEKDALVKAGKIKKDKHESFIFKGDDNCYHENIDGKVTDITEDIPFDLPDEWEWCRLSTISEFDLGKTLDRQKNTGNYRKYLRSVNVLWGNIDLSDVKEMRFEDTELERYSIKKGDLLICEGGDVGRCAVWDKDFVFYYQNALHRVRFYQKCISLFFQFVMMFFENTGLLKEISQGVTIKHLTKNTLNSMFFPLPPLAEQKRIVSQVEKLFTVLETMRG